MQAEYRKEKAETYFRIQKDSRKDCNYEEKMLEHNPGEGKLEFSVQEEDGTWFYRYKITGRKAMSGIYAMMSIGERQIRNVLCQIFKIMEDAKEYLLPESGFVLLPSYIFATLPKMEIELCYVPGYHVPVKEQLESLFEYLLNRVDYEDKEAVELLYDCYMLCVRGRGSMDEIKERVRKGEEETGQETGKEKTEVMVLEKERRGTDETAFNGRQAPEKKENEPSSYMNWLTDLFFHRKKKEALLVAEKQEEYHAGKTETDVWEEEAEQPTQLLSIREETETAQLLNEETGEVVFLNKLPFYIGSVSKYADYVLPTPGVSRIHCCIQKRDEDYYLSDLNSTNGTYLDGKEVLPGKEELLWNGAVLRIAGTEFYVKVPCH